MDTDTASATIDAFMKRVNAIIGTILIALLAWVGLTVQATSVSLARVEEQVIAMRDSRELVHIERRLDLADDHIKTITTRLRLVETKVRAEQAGPQ